MNTSGLSQNQKLERPPGPAANDDLTIADHIRDWHRAASGQGGELYREGSDPVFRVTGAEAQQFIKEHGALHPGDYLAKYGRDWRRDFKALVQQD